MPDPLDKSAERSKHLLREDPFQDSSGKNPFGDPKQKGDTSAPGSDNIFATSTDAAQGADQRVYVTTQEPRGALLLFLGIGGVSICGIGIAMMVLRNHLPFGDQALPIPFLSLAASVPAVTLSYADMQAMEAGAMSNDGWPTARVSLVLGAIGCLLVLVYVAGIAAVMKGWVVM